MWLYRLLMQSLKALVYAGIDQNSKVHQVHRLESINSFCLLCVFVSIPYYFLFYKYEMPVAFFSMFINHILFFTVVYFNKLKKYTLANFILIFVTQGSVFSLSIMLGYNTGFYQFLYTAPFFVFWIFKVNEIKKIVLTAFTYLVSLTLLLYFNKIVHPLYALEDQSDVMLFQKFNLILSIVIIFFLFYNHMTYYTLLIDSTFQKQKSLEIEVEKRMISEKKTQKLFDDLTISYSNLKEFNYVVSHNLRAPISNILGLLSILDKSNEKNETNLITLDYIERSTKKLDEIINDLNFILEEKNQFIEKEAINAKIFFKIIEGKFEEVIQNKKILIQYNIEENIEIYSSRAILENVICYILDNSLKYTSEKEQPYVIIDVIKDKNLSKILIHDNGIGIDLEKHRNKIFKLFSKINPIRDGKGIGLYIAKTQIERLGGKIEIESKLNVGTTFTITLTE